MKNQSQISTSTNKNQQFYNTGDWRNLRDWFMSLLENLLCRRCLSMGIITPAEIADHIIEISDNWDLRLDPLNLQPLCWCCHNTKTAEQRTKRNQKAPTASSLMNPPNAPKQLNEPAVPTTTTNNLMRFLNARANTSTNKNQST